MADEVIVLVDIGSTFTKVTAVAPSGTLVSRVVAPTRHDDLAAGAQAAINEARGTGASEVLMCSSAAGGLRVAVIGLEPQLTLEAGTRAAATAGARVVASFAGVLDSGDADALAKIAPDVVLLAGGTNGGDRVAIVANARRMPEILPRDVPVVVAGNEDVSREVAAVAGESGRIVVRVPNVLPRIGEINVDAAQHAIRDLFVEHVIGRGRFASASSVAAAIRMPTPSAVLTGAQILARLGNDDPRLRAPVVVDVGGATTDVHSVLPVDTSPSARREPVPELQAKRSVEGDLGLRENAESLVEEAARSGLTNSQEGEVLRRAGARRAADRTFLPTIPGEAEEDRRLATLAAALALSRHAGELRFRWSPEGATIGYTGRDLRGATCLVVTGGVFEADPDAVGIAEAALAAARARRALVPEDIPIFVDREHLFAVAGLLDAEHPSLAALILRRAFAKERVEQVA